jgi:hypothetical protein
MPVRDDMHRSCGAACRADEAQADARPWLILRECVEPHVDPAITEAVQALDAAGHMAVSQPFTRRAGRIMAGPFVYVALSMLMWSACCAIEIHGYL